MPSRIEIRRDGFSGQHLMVLPTSVRQMCLAHPLLRDLYVSDAGYFPSAAGHLRERPVGASTEILIVCLAGQGWVSSAGKVTQIGAGDAVWIQANCEHSYGAGELRPWTIVWAHFGGASVPLWRKQLGWPDKARCSVASYGSNWATTLPLDKVYARMETGYAERDLLATATALRATFCALLDLASGPGAIRNSAERTASVRGMISANPERPFKLSELATTAGLSTPHFCSIFKSQTGYSPIDFVLRERIRKACGFLSSTTESINLISAAVGFQDPYYFSRIFRKIMGVSPKLYRSTHNLTTSSV